MDNMTQTLNTKEAAARLNTTPDHVLRLAKDGDLPFTTQKRGIITSYHFNESDVNKHIAANRRGAAPVAKAIKFVDPPRRKHGKQTSRYAGVAAELKANPGMWCMVAEKTTQGFATSIKTGSGAWGDGKFEVTTRVNGEFFDVYVRYVGK